VPTLAATFGVCDSLLLNIRASTIPIGELKLLCNRLTPPLPHALSFFVCETTLRFAVVCYRDFDPESETPASEQRTVFTMPFANDASKVNTLNFMSFPFHTLKDYVSEC
jgi:hypothetical protein